MSKRTRKRLPIVHGGAYKKGRNFKVRTTSSGDVVFPGTVQSVQELKDQYQIMLTLKADAKKVLHEAQRTTWRLEKRESLLALATQVDNAVDKLEDAVGTLHRMLTLLVGFANTPVPIGGPE